MPFIEYTTRRIEEPAPCVGDEYCLGKGGRRAKIYYADAGRIVYVEHFISRGDDYLRPSSLYVGNAEFVMYPTDTEGVKKIWTTGGRLCCCLSHNGVPGSLLIPRMPRINGLAADGHSTVYVVCISTEEAKDSYADVLEFASDGSIVKNAVIELSSLPDVEFLALVFENGALTTRIAKFEATSKLVFVEPLINNN
jgi:hypothetical protein